MHGAIGYADDVSLLCPSLSSLRMLLNITDIFCREFNVDFNPNKYLLLVYRNDSEPVHGIYYNNSFVKAQQYGKHLGNIIGPNVGNKDVINVVDNLCISCNALLNTFPMLSGKAKYRLFKTYCMPLYGSIHWDLSCSYMQMFFTQWRKCVRKIFNIPFQTHSNLLPSICEDLPVENQMWRRAIKFYGNAFCSTNSLVKLCTNLAVNGSHSKACNTLGYIAFKQNTNKVQLLKWSEHFRMMSCKTDISEKCKKMVGNILDLLKIRDCNTTAFTYEEIQCMLTCVHCKLYKMYNM